MSSGIRANDEIERRVQQRGRELLAGMEPELSRALTPGWWQGRMMGWASGDPDFRVKLLRFVDVLPTLRTSGAVAEHVRQYFGGDSPLPVRIGRTVAGARLLHPALSGVVRQGVFAMADRFIGGESPQEALPRLRELVREGTAYTIDLLGEATLSEQEADVYIERYLELLETLSTETHGGEASRAAGKVNISVKLSALTSHFEPAAPEATSRAVRERLVPLLRRARELGAFVNIDMEQYRFKDLTHRVARDVLEEGEFRDWADAGTVVQAYLQDAAEDIERLRNLARSRGTPITVRLVKGAYWDEEVIVARQEGHPVPVFEDKAATDLNYEHCAELLVAAYPHLRPAFASHNARSIASAMVLSERAGLPREDVEFQFLYGMAEGLRESVARTGYLTRVYVPTGEIIPGMAYLVRRLLENTSNESWFMQSHEDGEPAHLLARPELHEQAEVAHPGFANHPTAEFHLPGPRREMAAALEDVRKRFGARYPVVVAGNERKGEWDEVRCPAEPGAVMGYVGRGDRRMVDEAVEVAKAAFPKWRERGARGRAAILRKAADRLARRRYEFAATMVFESGKPSREADGDVVEAIDYLRYYAAAAERLERGQPLMDVPGEENRYVYEPRGVAAIIAPWNFPLAIITGMSTAALASGCTAILKPASQSPIIGAMLVELLHDSGVPRDVVHYLPGPGSEVGQSLVDHPGVDVIAFTGSSAVGLRMLESAAKVRPGQRDLKRVIAEMGGKNAVIVDDDADLDQAVAGVVTSAFGYAGQKCSACSRVIVVGDAYGEFRTRLAAAVESLIVGPPEDAYTYVPPVISAAAKRGIEEYIEVGLREGRLVAKGASREDGHYVAPHVFENVPLDSRLTCEEVFGPVLATYRAKDFDESLRLALDSPFALTGGLYSRNPERIERAKREFRVGNLYINRKVTGAVVGRQPFGGFAMSGVGDKAGGPDYLQQFTVARVVTENTVRRGFAPEDEADRAL